MTTFMRHSQLDVESKVNMKFVDADRPRINDALMAQKSPYQLRFDAMVEHLKAPTRAAWGRMFGSISGQQLYNWYTRDQRIPDDMRKPLLQRGISLDWVNDGEGEMLVSAIAGDESQAVRDAEDRMTKAATAVITQFRVLGGEFVPERDFDLVHGVYRLLAQGATVIDATKWLIHEIERTGVLNVGRNQAGSTGS